MRCAIKVCNNTSMIEEEEGDCGKWDLRSKKMGKRKKKEKGLNVVSFNTSRNFNL